MQPTRVLHVIGAMNRGGVETWLMHVLRRLDRANVQMDFLVHTDQPAAFDDEIRELGSRVLPCPEPREALSYARRFRKLVEEYGPYDVLHSHVHHHSGIVLGLGRQLGIPVRIAHSHNDLRSVAEDAGVLRKVYLNGSRRLISANCTHGLAASRAAACDLFGEGWERDARCAVLHCGIALDAFEQRWDREVARGEFGFGAEHLVFGHVGRFEPQKNHALLAAIAREVVQREPRARFLLIGDGPLRASIEEQVRRDGIAGSVVFAGLRPDVPRVMQAAMDRFVFPSLYEGLGLALIEAQAADLPSIVSDVIPDEATVVPQLVRRLSLKEPPAVWAEEALSQGKRCGRALAELRRSPFDVEVSFRALLRVYRPA